MNTLLCLYYELLLVDVSTSCCSYLRTSAACAPLLYIIGAFLIPYFIMLAFAGLPIFFMEVILGQYSGVGPNKLFEMAPLFKGTRMYLFYYHSLQTIINNIN